MSLLYKNEVDVIHSVEIKHHKDSDNVHMIFYCDGGKFGTDEILDEYDLTPIELLDILQKHGE